VFPLTNNFITWAYGLVVMTSPSHLVKSIEENDLFEYLNIIELSGITNKHKKETKRALLNYLNHIDWKIDKTKSLSYFKQIKNNYSIAYYKKQMYQIMKYLKHNKVEWVSDIKLPPDPHYRPKRVTNEDVNKTIEYLKDEDNFLRHRTLVLLGCTSGLRAEELYKLTPDDIDMDTRTVYVRHDPRNNHSTKTKESRISFFTIEACDSLKNYLYEYNHSNSSSNLFPQRMVERTFKDAPIRVKDLRKAFSQEWTKRQGDSGIKKILMGHSLKNDIDLMHYATYTDEELRQIYHTIMN